MDCDVMDASASCCLLSSGEMVGGGVGLTNQSKSTCAVPQASHASQLRSVEAVPFPLYSLLSINTIVTNTRTLLEHLSDKRNSCD